MQSNANLALIGKRITLARKQKKLSRRIFMIELRKRGLDVAEATLCNWEHGYTAFRVHQLVTLAEVLGVSVGYFFGEKDNQLVGL